ncbi:unnamed protein product [Echinostoma caproni]|uniref:Retrotrans_gag domain-containing protein n=1 Tax=Echinostoma caproni TaxID=27848 RepID=A0A183BB35_9TREM|nr:unnamed protein product [Echinostoma caproni]
MDRESSSMELGLFRHTTGPVALRVINRFAYRPVKDSADWQMVIAKMERYCPGESNETYERFIFKYRRQQRAESLSAFVQSLKSLTRSCNFRACLEERLIKDRIVVDLRDSAVVKRLLKPPKLTLKQCIGICLIHVASEKHM